jgi:oligoribonuclease NrnB/cAMP/cGMP phosphodiesterase (DHH superfamily)
MSVCQRCGKDLSATNTSGDMCLECACKEINGAGESEAKGVELSEEEWDKILAGIYPVPDVLAAISIKEQINEILKARLASQKAALKEAVIKAIPKEITDVIHGSEYVQGRKEGFNIAIAEFTKSVHEAFKEAGK